MNQNVEEEGQLSDCQLIPGESITAMMIVRSTVLGMTKSGTLKCRRLNIPDFLRFRSLFTG